MHKRRLGTMITYGYPDIALDDELDLAVWLGASVLEILPEWSCLPDPALVRRRVGRSWYCRFTVRTAAGAGERSGRGGSTWGRLDAATHRESIDDLKGCADWLAEAGGKCLVVHPGGLSLPEGADRAAGGACERALGAGRACAVDRCDHLCRKHAARGLSWQPHGRAGRDLCASSTILSSRWRLTRATPI